MKSIKGHKQTTSLVIRTAIAGLTLSLTIVGLAMSQNIGDTQGCTPQSQKKCMGNAYCVHPVPGPYDQTTCWDETYACSNGTCAGTGGNCNAYSVDNSIVVGSCQSSGGYGSSCTLCNKIFCAQGKRYDKVDIFAYGPGNISYVCKEPDRCGWIGYTTGCKP